MWLQALKRAGWEMVIVYNSGWGESPAQLDIYLVYLIISSELHAIFAKEYKDGYFHCINSHGGEDPEPRVRKEQVTHLYYVAISRVPEDI